MNILMQIGPSTVFGALVIGLLFGGCLVAIVVQVISRAKAKTFEHDLQRQINGAKKEAENIIKSAQIDAAAETIKKKEQFTSEANKIRAELHETEMRLTKREDSLDRQTELLRQREKSLKQQQQEIDRRLHNINLKEKQLSILLAQQKNQLLKITAMDIEEAKDLLLKRLEDECEHEMSALIQRKVVAQTKKDVNHKLLQIGKDAAVETNVRGLSNKVLSLIGALSYRTSYGQNVLRHSVEVAFLSQVMADELGLDGSIARRAGLLHDIGKAIDHDVEGNHPTIGANYLKRFNESPVVLNAVAGHHGDITADNPYTPLVAAADAVSASRPGARRETLERYIKRLEKLEEIAGSFKGVENAYAIQAGREIRVIVSAEQVDDEAAMKIARDIANKVEGEMTYPGEIQVTLLREVRCVEYAK